MHVFQIVAKLWPTGDSIDLGSNITTFGAPPGEEDNTAAPFVASDDGSQVYQFLFWHTGRRLTNKRSVRWVFSTMNWDTWTATKWYGIPSGGSGGPPRVHVEPFNLVTNALITSGTAIDGPASTYSPASAYPFSGNDKEIGTAGGPATVAAKDPFASKSFAGWMRLVWGGDSSGEFIENDSGVTASSVPDGGASGGGVFDHVPGVTYSAAQNTSHEVIATYGTSSGGGGGFGPPPSWREIVEIVFPHIPKLPDRGDPPPWDILRARLLEELIRRTQPVRGGGPTDFQNIIDSASKMSAAELKTTLRSLQTTMDLGKTALSTIEAQLKRTTKK